MKNKLLIIFLITIVFTPLYAKTLNSMAKSAQGELRELGATLIGVGVVWAGLLYIKGGGEGKQKFSEVATAAFLILAVGAIIGFIRNITG